MLGIIKNKNGEKIDYTFHYGSEKNRFLLIVAHGVTADKDAPLLTTLSERVATEGMSVLRFSFTGNGESEGRFEECTISKEINDLQSILTIVTEHGWRPIFAGHSMGSAVGVLTASIDSRIQLLISLAGVVSTEVFCEAEFGNIMPGEGYMWGNTNCPLSHEFVNDMKQIKSVLPRASGLELPWLLVHGTADEIVPITESNLLLSNIENSRELVEVDGADHLFSGNSTNTLADSVIDWLGRKLQVN
jgi:alpha/beta superfamily hydrolase